MLINRREFIKNTYFTIDDISFLSFTDEDKTQMCKILNKKISQLVNSSFHAVSEHAKNMKSAILIEIIEMAKETKSTRGGKRRQNAFSYKDAQNVINRVIGSPVKHPPMTTVLVDSAHVYKAEVIFSLDADNLMLGFDAHCEDDCSHNIPEALSSLNATERQFIELVYFHGYTQKESATLIGLSSDNISAFHKSIINKLKDNLNAC